MINIREIKIDIPSTDNVLTERIFAGYVGEHNATRLALKLPDSMIKNADYHVISFQTQTKNYRSKNITSDSSGAFCDGNMIYFPLSSVLTGTNLLSFTVEAYETGEDGVPVCIWKSPMCGTLVFKNAVVADETASGEVGGNIITLAQIAENTAARHTHINKDVLDKLGEDTQGNLLFDGEKIGVSSGDGSEKNIKSGLIIGILGDSISTKEGENSAEIRITEKDVGKTLSAYLTYYDCQSALNIGGQSFTADQIGTEVTFIPTAEDVGKVIGKSNNYNSAATKVWWEYLEDMGATVNPVCWSGSSVSSHESEREILKTSHAWHDAQIRKLGTRIEGSTDRKSPDVVIIYRGCNDMTHEPYALLTQDYFKKRDENGNYCWSCPDTDLINSQGEENTYGYKEALSITIKKIRESYPKAQIVLAVQNVFKRVNCSEYPTNNGLYSLPEFCEATREVADFFGCHTIDFDKDGITFENCYSGGYITDDEKIPTHPNSLGHSVMAKQAINDLDKKLDIYNIEPLNSVTVYRSVTNNLTYVTTDNSASKVASDVSYEASLTARSGYRISSVTVTMDGTDITGIAYSDGKIRIDCVTGDVVITALAVKIEEVTVIYNVTNSLTNVTSDNTSTFINEGDSYTATLTADIGIIRVVTVIMNGVDVTSSVYAEGRINIPEVTGNIDITATASAVGDVFYAVKNNLINVDTNNLASTVQEGTVYSAMLSSSFGAIQTVKVMMGDEDITAQVYSGGIINIERVMGNIDITAVVRATSQSRATTIPEGATCETDLFDYYYENGGLGKGYYNGNGTWVDLSNDANSKARTVTIPVIPGDRIKASSFQKYGTTGGDNNGNTVNSSSGTRVGFFLDQTLVESRPVETVHSEYNQYGYITVPEGVNCASVPFFNDGSESYDNWFYLLTL